MCVEFQVWVYKLLKNAKAFFRLLALACWDSADREQHRVKGSKTAMTTSMLNFRVPDMNLPVSCTGVVFWQELLRILRTLLQSRWLAFQLAPSSHLFSSIDILCVYFFLSMYSYSTTEQLRHCDDRVIQS